MEGDSNRDKRAGPVDQGGPSCPPPTADPAEVRAPTRATWHGPPITHDKE